MRISKDYESQLKEALQSEVDARELEVTGTGSNGAITKDDLVLALQMDDEANAQSSSSSETAEEEPPQPPAPLPPLKASPIPKVNPVPEIFDPMTTAPKDEDFTDGVFKRKSDGEQYALCIHEADQYGKTHSCKNSLHFWQGDADSFDKEFSKR